MANVITEEVLNEITLMHRDQELSWKAIAGKLKRTRGIKYHHSSLRKAYMKSIEKPDIPRNAMGIFDEKMLDKIAYLRDSEKLDWEDIGERFGRPSSSVQSAYQRYKRRLREFEVQPFAINA